MRESESYFFGQKRLITFGSAVLTLVAMACRSDTQNQPASSNFAESGNVVAAPTVTFEPPLPTVKPEEVNQANKDHQFPHVGEKVPDFALEDSEGKLVSLSQFKGKPVVILYSWNTDGSELEIDKTLVQYQAKGLTVLPVAATEMGVGVLQNRGYNFVLKDSEKGRLSDFLQTPAFPDISVIDGSGILIAHISPLNTIDYSGLNILYDKLIAGEPIVGPVATIDTSLVGIPLDDLADNYVLLQLLNNFQVTDEDNRFLAENKIAIDNLLESANSEEMITEIIDDLRARGKMLAQIYCRGGYQPDTFGNMSRNATFLARRYQDYARKRIMDPSGWPQIAADIKPNCALRDSQ